MPSVLDVILVTRMLLHLSEIIIISDANDVGTNGPKAGVHSSRAYDKRRTHHRLGNVRLE
jgi:hypothetical protein